MKILILSPGYFPVPSGAEVSMHNTLKYLHNQGIECNVLTLSDYPSLINIPKHNEIKDGVNIFRTNKQDYISELIKFDVDIIIVQMLERFKALNIDLQPHIQSKKWIYMQRADAQSDISNSKYTVLNSKHSLDIYLSYHNKAKNNLFILTPPMDIPKEIDLSNKRESITIINPCTAKGGDAFLYLAYKMPQYNFIAQLGWTKPVEGLDKLSNITILNPTDDIQSVYNKTSVLLVPSLTEPFGRVALEGALSGCIVLASYIEGLKEIPLPNQSFVKQFDLNIWHKKLQHILSMNSQELLRLREITFNKAKYYKSDLQGFYQFILKIHNK